MNIAPEKLLVRMEYLLLLVAPLADVPIYHDAVKHQSAWVLTSSFVCLALVGLLKPKTLVGKWALVTAQVLLCSIATFVGNERLFRFLFLVPIARACVLFDLQARIGVLFVVWILASIAIVQRIGNYHTSAPSPLYFASFVLSQILQPGAVYALTVLLATVLFSERKERQELQIANDELHRSRERVAELTVQADRVRIARDLHDAVGNAITALNIQLENVTHYQDSDPARARQFLGEARETSRNAMRDLRQAVHELRGGPEAAHPLRPQLEKLVSDFQTRDHLSVTLDYALAADPPDPLQTSIKRIIGEALSNVHKHARASCAVIQVYDDAEFIRLRIADDGIGLSNDSRATKGFGIIGMAERAQIYGGSLIVQNNNGRGTVVEASFLRSRRGMQ